MIVSIDGFKPEFLNFSLTPNLMKFAKNGVLSRNMLPVFPSKTFPNHHSLSTGLYAESHGIVDNRMVLLNKNCSGFALNFNKDSKDAFWWNFNNEMKPIYIANQINSKNHKSATIFWPGSCVSYNSLHTSQCEKKYDQNFNGSLRIELSISYLKSNLYNLIMVYLDDFDKIAHKYGPDNQKSRLILKEVDKWLGKLFLAVSTDLQTDVIIVSDHGFKQLKISDRIDYSEVFSNLKVKIITNGAVVGLYPKKFENYHDLINKSKYIVKELNKVSKNRFTAYTKDQVPPELHYSNSNRIPSVIIVMKNGHYLYDENYFKPGTHGWPVIDDPDMRALFIAKGPSFKKNVQIDSISVTDIYMLSCHVLKIEKTCHPHNDF
ncbi:hypothetical protein MXB_1628 [Myxobolus squamalis]|nr:hypothetical protein MXB_1628 [Myxobolus squamalis]